MLDQALDTLAADGNLKFYGGEPTLHTPEIVEAMRYVRERGFTGLITVFSNGIQAEKLIAILESDPKSEAVLNYSIYHGRDAKPMPRVREGAPGGVGASEPEPHLPGVQGAVPRRRREPTRSSTGTASRSTTAWAPAACAASRC